MRNLLSLSTLTLIALQSAFPQAATEAALAHAHAAATTSKVSKVFTDMPNITKDRITQSVQGNSAMQPASHAKPVVMKSGKAAATSGAGKKPPATTTRANATPPAPARGTGEGPKIISILGGEQQR
jgi:hypothetical protein